MTDTADAATAASEFTEDRTYEEPNERYPHPSSLQCPQGVASGSPDLGRSEQYVDYHIGQLRFFIKSGIISKFRFFEKNFLFSGFLSTLAEKRKTNHFRKSTFSLI